MELPDRLLRCPGCREGYLAVGGQVPGSVRCRRCFSLYPVKGGVVDLLPQVRTPRSFSQAVMGFEPVVRVYESRLGRRNPALAFFFGISFEREQEVILDAAALRGTERVLDLACGTGIYARPIARRLPRGYVVGFDLSLPMLEHASRRAVQGGVENVIWVRGDAEHLPFPSCAFDVVNCCGALHHFPDVARVLREVCRALVPGGRLTLAALRRRRGWVFDAASVVSRVLLGLDAFTSDDVESRLRAAGFDSVRCHHAAGDWLIMSAARSSMA